MNWSFQPHWFSAQYHKTIGQLWVQERLEQRSFSVKRAIVSAVAWHRWSRDWVGWGGGRWHVRGDHNRPCSRTFWRAGNFLLFPLMHTMEIQERQPNFQCKTHESVLVAVSYINIMCCYKLLLWYMWWPAWQSAQPEINLRNMRAIYSRLTEARE